MTILTNIAVLKLLIFIAYKQITQFVLIVQKQLKRMKLEFKIIFLSLIDSVWDFTWKKMNTFRFSRQQTSSNSQNNELHKIKYSLQDNRNTYYKERPFTLTTPLLTACIPNSVLTKPGHYLIQIEENICFSSSEIIFLPLNEYYYNWFSSIFFFIIYWGIKFSSVQNWFEYSSI